ncbi:DUF2927 domain-containing protein [Roseibium aestuarii]|uniref:DUF2927 domain-containing protein n=1 Tax=Roseibium aestuarii TaxID=2600299 RepID=A0ABW4JVQ1_9HYPH|nr:DUF2927 domain-containing protein [Roseibium aestuarii]
MLRLPRLFLLSLLLACLAPEASARAQEDRVFTTEELIDGFNKTVFGLEYRSWSWRPYQVKKYTRPVRFYVHNPARIDRRPTVQAFLRQLESKISGIEVELAESPESANFEIFVVDRADYLTTVREQVYRKASADAPGRCLVRVVSGRDGIKRSTSVIVSDEGEFIFRRCMVEETLQGLGPMNDDTSLTHSVFNDESRHNRFTAFDRLLLNMLYDPRIRPGMSRKDTDALLPLILRDLRARLP